jgi:predicted nucleic acid-binding protein
MAKQVWRIFLDTNIYIVGSIDDTSPEAEILRYIGYSENPAGGIDIEVVVSEDLFDEIRRVAKRLRNKDWAGEILARLWQNMRLHYVLIDQADVEQLAMAGIVPTEDIEVYLTARNGQADCFVSANHELIRLLAQRTGEFDCLTPAAFVTRHIP